jgi:HK97 gp10 family phage protein
MARVYGKPVQLGPRGAVGSSVRVVGVEQAIAKLNTAVRYAKLELAYTTTATAAIVETAAKQNVPTISGNLQSGIKTKKVGPYDSIVTASSREGDVPEKNNKEYAGFVEFGTSKMRPRYFMKRAWAQAYPYAANRLQVLARKLESL